MGAVENSPIHRGLLVSLVQPLIHLTRPFEDQEDLPGQSPLHRQPLSLFISSGEYPSYSLMISLPLMQRCGDGDGLVCLFHGDYLGRGGDEEDGSMEQVDRILIGRSVSTTTEASASPPSPQHPHTLQRSKLFGDQGEVTHIKSSMSATLRWTKAFLPCLMIILTNRSNIGSVSGGSALGMYPGGLYEAMSRSTSPIGRVWGRIGSMLSDGRKEGEGGGGEGGSKSLRMDAKSPWNSGSGFLDWEEA